MVATGEGLAFSDWPLVGKNEVALPIRMFRRVIEPMPDEMTEYKSITLSGKRLLSLLADRG